VPGAPLTLSLYEAVDAAGAAAHAGGEDTYAAWYQAGRVTHEIIGAAQVDRRGRVNNLELVKPSGAPLRLAGQGGMADVANMHAHSVLYVTRHSPQSVVEEVRIASSARGLHGAARAAAGYREGRVIVLTNLCLFAFDEAAGELVVAERMPGVSRDEIVAATGFAPRFADPCPEIPLPDAATLRVLRERVDPLGLRRLEFVPARERAALLDEILAADRAILRAAAGQITETAGQGARAHG
jgi:glutaconate CoA-transferase subunit A